VVGALLKGSAISTFTFIHLADAFIQSDLQLLYMSEVTRLWSVLLTVDSNPGLSHQRHVS